MNVFDKYSNEAKNALFKAEEEAKKDGTGYIGTEHVLLGILSQKNTLGYNVLASFGVSTKNVRLVMQNSGRHATDRAAEGGGELELSTFAKKIVEEAAEVANKFHHSQVGTEHLLYALLSQKNTAATVVLENMKVSTAEMQKKIEEVFQQNEAYRYAVTSFFQPLEKMLSQIGGGMMAFSANPVERQAEPGQGIKKDTEAGKDSKTPALDFFTTDLTAEARQGKLDPIIGRDYEIGRVISILSRRTKNNPVLIGEAGVGKTAVAEGLAQRIATEMVPANLLDKKVLMLDMSSVVAGTKYRGEFEVRMKQIIDEASVSENEVILFVDEIHTLIGAGSAEGSMDAANILKPALGRGKVQVIGATTLKEYRRIEKDPALERRFQPVQVEEPKEDEAVQILEGLRPKFEEYHNLRITPEAIKAAVTLSKRYLHDRFLPDKAIDLIDEAAAAKAVRVSDQDLVKMKKLRRQIAAVVAKKEAAAAAQNYAVAENHREEELKLTTELQKLKTNRHLPESLKPVIGEEEIAGVVSQITRVPLTKMLADDIANLRDLETVIEEKLRGQTTVVKRVAQAIRRNRVGLTAKNRPIASFLFLGPTGVGKTEMVRILSKEIYHNPDALIKIDMSEFMERHNASRLVGAAAGYVGYEEGGQLTEAVRRKPYSIVLFDEIEKAHPEVFNILLQILEDGSLTDNKGRRIDFSNTIVVMTSNLGSEQLNREAASIGFNLTTDEQKAKEQEFNMLEAEVQKTVRNFFKPELVNRIDQILVFKPLDKAAIADIVQLGLKELSERLHEKHYHLTYQAPVLSYLTEKSYHPESGGRMVRRVLATEVEDRITEAILAGKIKPGAKISLKIVKKELQVA